MKTLGTVIAIVGLLVLGGCASHSAPVASGDLQQETWMHSISLDTGPWVRGADSWYLTGTPNAIEKNDLKAIDSQTISTMTVHVPDFTDVSVLGAFQVQIVGRQEHNSVYIVGPNAALRDLIVDVNSHRLSIYTAKKSKQSFKDIIVRINIHDLKSLQNDGNVYGRDVLSDQLSIHSSGKGNVFLFGNMNLTMVEQSGQGNMVILGANTTHLDIHAIGAGNVNINGRVGINHIVHPGAGTVRVLGADTDSLIIDASGKGYTAVVGYANLKKVVAADSSRVYVYWLSSHDLSVNATGSARIGLAGVVKNMRAELAGSSRLDGQYCRTDATYIKTQKESHANVYVNRKIFAAAVGASSIYLFGNPLLVSSYTHQSGTIIPISTVPIPMDMPEKNRSVFSPQ